MKNREPLIQIFCKAPVLGKVKTRLIQEIGARRALDLYKQMFERLMADFSLDTRRPSFGYRPTKIMCSLSSMRCQVSTSGR